MTVESPRGEIEARALVTRRIKPMLMDGKTIHQIGIPFQWGYAGETVGSMANDLTSTVADPNVSMHEAKVFACRVRAGPRARPADGADQAGSAVGQPRTDPRHACRGAARRPPGEVPAKRRAGDEAAPQPPIMGE